MVNCVPIAGGNEVNRMETTTKLELLDPAALIPSAANPRVHSQRQIRELRASLRE